MPKSIFTFSQSRRSLLVCVCAMALASVAMGASAKPAAPPAPRPPHETATFAAGCFWSMEAIFKQLKGVASATPGYAGGKMAHPSYEQVESGNTGHAETI